jgi:hypothetical protein
MMVMIWTKQTVTGCILFSERVMKYRSWNSMRRYIINFAVETPSRIQGEDSYFVCLFVDDAKVVRRRRGRLAPWCNCLDRWFEITEALTNEEQEQIGFCRWKINKTNTLKTIMLYFQLPIKTTATDNKPHLCV